MQAKASSFLNRFWSCYFIYLSIRKVMAFNVSLNVSSVGPFSLSAHAGTSVPDVCYFNFICTSYISVSMLLYLDSYMCCLL